MAKGKILIEPELLMEVLLLKDKFQFDYISMSKDENNIELIVESDLIKEVQYGADMPTVIITYQKQEPIIIKTIEFRNN